MKLWYCKAIERPIHRRPALPPELQLPYIYVWNKNIKTAHPVPVSEICELYAEFKKKKKGNTAALFSFLLHTLIHRMLHNASLG